MGNRNIILKGRYIFIYVEIYYNYCDLGYGFYLNENKISRL